MTAQRKFLLRAKKKITAALDSELAETMNQYIDAQAETILLSNTDSFIYGYRLGVLMTMEIFNGSDTAIFGRAEQ